MSEDIHSSQMFPSPGESYSYYCTRLVVVEACVDLLNPRPAIAIEGTVKIYSLVIWGRLGQICVTMVPGQFKYYANNTFLS